ncbi:MAG: SDR family NAD(P)-dependent oxidoreductase, partial [bacterium]|nr:SDR family NAD(P)-dependent oxidoreductase [bacterium]
ALPGAWERRDDAVFALETLGRLWLAGVEVDWSGFYARERRRRRTLPTYPFERRHYWVDPDDITAVAEGSAADGQVRVTLDKQEDLDDWLYHPVWEAVPRPEAAADEGSPGGGQMEGCWLLLGDSEGSSSALAEALRESGREVVEATCTDRAEDYVTLLESLRAQGRVIRHLVHLAGLTAPAPDGDAFAESWRRGFLSLLYLAQAVGRLGLADPARPLALAVVTAGSFRVTGDEALRPESALAVGPCKVIPQEFPGLTCRQIDIFPDASEAGWIELLAAELGGDGSEELVAYRQGERFVRRFERLPVADGAPRLKERGTYLLTGGLGGLGMTLAEHLAHRYQARLVLIDRSPLPEPEAWSEWLEEHGDDDPLSVKIRKLRALGERGAEILALTADAADVEQMTRARDRALERFGTIDGVVHLAGIPGGGVIQLKTPEAAEAIVVPKVRGALVLAEVLRELQPDFVVLYSSIASILGEFGQVDYGGANAFLDVFASHWRTRSDSFV